MSVSKTTPPWVRESGLCREARLAALGVPHGFTLKSLGDMKVPANMEEALSRAGLARKTPLLLKQKHGMIIHRAAPGQKRLEGDGWVSDVSGLPVAVYSADCIPLLVWDRDLKAVGAFHAGWRGLAAGMVEAAVETFRALGLAPAALRAAAGPHARPCCYRVGPELEERFRPESFSRRPEGLFLDLGAEARARFVQAGLDPREVTACPDCTICSGDYFSWRREAQDHRILSFIVRP
ncbi:MAG TPA: hypothetical protein DCM05_08735 [Elusimicrobia bacterium]|nr:hypothetical protein [Elusimicrobiota bacterium]